MDAAGIAMTVAGVVLLLLGFGDAMLTTTAIGEFRGPITRGLSVSLWRGVRAVTSRSDSALLRATGSLVVLSVVSAWVLSIWLGWSLVFAGTPGAVVHADSGEQASFASVIYFTAASVATTGLGDFVPSSDGWRLLTGLVSVSGIAVITLAVTYLVPIIQAAVNRLHLAQRLNSMGSTPYDILDRHFDGEGFGVFEERIPALVDELTQLRAEHLAYPVLHFLHGSRAENAFAPRVAALDEALTILEHGVDEKAHPSHRVVQPLREAIDALLHTVVQQAFTRPTMEVPPVPDLAPVQEAGIPTRDDGEFAERVASEDDRRRELLSYVRDDSWNWHDVYREA